MVPDNGEGSMKTTRHYSAQQQLAKTAWCFEAGWLAVGLRAVGWAMLLSILWLPAACTESQSPDPGYVLTGSTMGTRYTIQLDQLPPGWTVEKLQADVESCLDAFNQYYSTYREDSLISRFNESQSDMWFSVPHDFAALVEQAQVFSELSLGAFDITVQPLVSLWGFSSTAVTRKPTAAMVDQTLKVVGYPNVVSNPDMAAIRKRIPELRMDLSAIAKGRAVDELGEWLTGLGIKNWLVEIGGELRVSGLNREHLPWRIGIQHPGIASPVPTRLITLTDEAVATSGDYSNYFVEDGQRYSHVIDPRTGYPVTHQTASVTVISKTTAQADAWATTLLVAGEEEGMRLATEHQLEAVFIVRTGEEGLETQLSPAMRR